MTITEPLKNIKIIDLSRILAGPWASQILGDLGGEVIKIENINGGDDTRIWGPPFISSEGQKSDSAYYLSANRQKKSIAIDFTTIEGQKIIHELIKSSDILLENFLPNKLKKYQLDYDTVKKINPKIVYCSITGYGQNGPLSHLPGYDIIIQAKSGLMSITGEENNVNDHNDKNFHPPLKTGLAISDIFTGLYATCSILAALRNAEKFGVGEHLDVSLFDCQLSVLANQAMNYFVSGKPPTQMGNKHPNIVPYELFFTKDKPLILAVGNDKQFASFCDIIGKEDWKEKYKTNAQRVKQRDILCKEIAHIFAKENCSYWIDILQKNNIPCGEVNNIKDACEENNTKERNLIQKFTREGEDEYNYLSYPVKFKNAKFTDKFAPPTYAQHSGEILANLGIADAKIKELRKKNIIK